MKNEFKMEKINGKNFDEFLFLVDQLADYEKLTPPDKAAKDRLKKDGLRKDPKYEAYICRLKDQPIGYFIFFMTYSSFLALQTFYLEDIFLLNEYRRNGFGKKMFEFCLNIAKKRNCGRMEWYVLNWNKTAFDFYSKYNPTNLCKQWSYLRLDKNQIKEYLKK